MAVTMIPLEASLRLVVIEGTSDKGEPILRVRTYSRVKPEADPQGVFEVGQYLVELQKYPLNDIQLTVNSALSEV